MPASAPEPAVSCAFAPYWLEHVLFAASELFMEAPLGFSGIVKADDEILQSEWLRLWARWLLELTLKARPPGSLLL